MHDRFLPNVEGHIKRIPMTVDRLIFLESGHS